MLTHERSFLVLSASSQNFNDGKFPIQINVYFKTCRVEIKSLDNRLLTCVFSIILQWKVD